MVLPITAGWNASPRWSRPSSVREAVDVRSLSRAVCPSSERNHARSRWTVVTVHAVRRSAPLDGGDRARCASVSPPVSAARATLRW